PPTASLTSPGSGATISGTATFSGTASDDHGVSRVEFWCDGSVLLGTATTSPYSITWNTANAANGAHTFTCKAYDTANQSTTSAAIAATVGNVSASLGQFLWSSDIGGTGASDSATGYTVAVDGNSNVVVAGNFTGTVDFGG